MISDWITTTEAADIIGCGRRHIAKLCQGGKLETGFFGAAWKIRRASAEAYRDNTKARTPGWKKGKKRPVNHTYPNRSI
jgi:excisionase family DNA binding protein